MMMIPLLSLLIFHGLLGGADVLLNHELAERLPSRISAHTEQALHSVREMIFGILFGGLAWLQWGGELVWCLAFLLLFELVISLWDTLLEDQIRRLSVLERSMHTLLFINLGAYSTLLVPILVHWYVTPTEFRLVYYGGPTWILSALSIAAFAWSVRDGLASITLRRKARLAASKSEPARTFRKHFEADPGRP